ncbi:MAG: hypothetical protein L6367_12680 [Cellulomonas sp.]|nr:hypothetical protein [Cellulomonas sp.]
MTTNLDRPARHELILRRTVVGGAGLPIEVWSDSARPSSADGAAAPGMPGSR